MKSQTRTGLIGLALSATIMIAPGCLDQLVHESRPEPDLNAGGTGEVINIESLPAGTILSDPVFGTNGSGPIHITGFNPQLPEQNAAVIFDSANPTGGDVDLGTPNQDFGGPGQGEGGDSGSDFPNTLPLGKLFIVDATLTDKGSDGLVDDPNDADVVGSGIDFDFAELGTVTVTQITIVDVEGTEANAIVDLYDPDDALIDSFVLPQVGDNGVATVSLGPTAGVERMRVTLNGSAAIDNIVFTPPNVGTGSIGDFVWCDTNRDGVQDAEEAPLPGVTVRLYDCDSNLLAKTQTAEGGLYLFTGLAAGCYEVVVDSGTAPEGCNGPGEHCPSQVTVNLAADQNFLDADFCFTPDKVGTGSIGDFVWCDTDRDGVQDAEESPLPGVTVRLYDCEENLLATTQTSEAGLYLFDDLAPGCYKVIVDSDTVPEGCNGTCSECPTKITVHLEAGQDFLDADFCFTPEKVDTGSIGDYVWCDEDRDGRQDAEESPLSGVTVRLFDCESNLLATTETNEGGHYLFDELARGCYKVVVDPETAPEGCNGTCGECPTRITVHLEAGQDFLDADFCFIPEKVGTGSIGDFVWCDEDRDGKEDAEESPLSGVTVRLYDCEHDLLATTQTNEGGHYLFDELEPGCYKVVVDPETAPEGCNETCGECPTRITVHLEAGQAFLDADFCFNPREEEGEGCSPGYWKNHLDSWAGYSPDQSVEDVFEKASLYPSIADASIREALSFGGGPGTLGGARLLVHHAVAALLNASHPGVDYSRSAEDIVSDVNAALLTEDRGTMLDLKGELDADNNLGCPLD